MMESDKHKEEGQINTKIYKMLYKMALSVTEIPPLFVQLDQLEGNEESDIAWNEKARWIRYEEQAEDVLGRWSKPHVATLPQTSLDELRHLINDGTFMFDVLLSDIKEIADAIANELIDYLEGLENAKKFAEILCINHHHHHEKKLKNRNHSQANLLKVVSSPNFHTIKENESSNSNEFLKSDESILNSPNQQVPSKMKYQYSFTDSMNFKEIEEIHSEFKENTKFKKKVHTKAEGASILVMPVDFVKTPKLVFLRLDAATELQSMLEVKLRSRFIVLVIGPLEKQHQLYEVGRAVATCMADDVCRELFYSAKSLEDINSVVDQFNKGTMVIPPSEWNPKIRIEPPEKFLSKEERRKEPELCNYIHDDVSKSITESDHGDANLQFSKRPFDGLYKDLSRKLKYYTSDFADFFNMQCIASTIYMYLVCLCSLVAFGGMLGEKLNNDMGTIECIIAGFVTGILFSMFSGQPLNIISATGPMLILEEIIKKNCNDNGIDFMEFRLWVGLWTGVFLLIFVAFNLSFLVKYITRFTEDSFASLVAIIFIIDSFKYTNNLDQCYKNRNEENGSYFMLNNTKYSCYLTRSNDSNVTYNETAKEILTKSYYFSVILFILTFFICFYLKEFRNKPFFPSKFRQFISDFAVFIAIVCASGIDYYFSHKIDTTLITTKLSIPDFLESGSINPTANRSWIVPFYGKNELFTYFLATIPAVFATVLIFMDQQITAVIINRKDLKMKKSNGYHLDLLVIAISVIGCSVLGLPWFVAATVLALSHINSLKMMSENTAPGERPTFVGIREQRGTTLVMSILIGLSIFLAKVLSLIPMAVLYGVFLFMGVSALRGMQLIDRILILFMPPKHQPDHKYLRYVSTNRVHLFTVIQILGLSLLYAIKTIKEVSILFPLMVVATSILRKYLDYVFTQSELFWLDDILPGSEKLKISKSEKKILNNTIDNNDSSPELCKHESHPFLKSDKQLELTECQSPVKFVQSFSDIIEGKTEEA